MCVSLRAQFSIEDVGINQLHGSANPEEAQKEIDFFFPMEQTAAMIKPEALGTKGNIFYQLLILMPVKKNVKKKDF